MYQCDNCGRSAAYDKLPDAQDAHTRLTPGGLYSNKECPQCGALCFPLPGDKDYVGPEWPPGTEVVLELAGGRAAVTLHQTAAAAVARAAACAAECLGGSSEDHEFDLRKFDHIKSGDYEVHVLRPTNLGRMDAAPVMPASAVDNDLLDMLIAAYEKFNRRDEGGEDDLHYAFSRLKEAHPFDEGKYREDGDGDGEELADVPDSLSTWSVDEAAECLSGITPEVHAELWDWLAKADAAGTAKPPGGDGSNGTFEEPVVTSGEYGSDLVAAWPHLSENARRQIRAAAAKM